MKSLDVCARLLMSLLFLFSGSSKLTETVATEAYMSAHGLPALLVYPAAVWEICAGCLLIAGLWIKPLTLLMAGWCVLTAAIFHTKFSDHAQTVNFLKNMVMAGGFLTLARAGSLGLSVDAWRAARPPVDGLRQSDTSA